MVIRSLSSFITAKEDKSTKIYLVLLFAVENPGLWSQSQLWGLVLCLKKRNPTTSITATWWRADWTNPAAVAGLQSRILLFVIISTPPLSHTPLSPHTASNSVTSKIRMANGGRERSLATCVAVIFASFQQLFFSCQVLREKEPKWLKNAAIYTLSRDVRAPLSPASAEKIGPHILWWHPISSKQLGIDHLAPMPLNSCHLTPTLPPPSRRWFSHTGFVHLSLFSFYNWILVSFRWSLHVLPVSSEFHPPVVQKRMKQTGMRCNCL